MNPNQRSILGAVLILIATLSLGVVVSQGMRGIGWIDTTSNDRYTLSEGTRQVIGKLNRPLTIKLFFSKKAVMELRTDQLMQFVRTYHYTRDLLGEYGRVSEGKLVIEEYDPEVFSPQAEEIVALGIEKAPLTQDRDGPFFAFGLAVTSQTGAKEVLSRIQANSEGALEYEISKLIERVARPKKAKIGVMSSLQVLGDNLSPEMARLRQLQRQSAGRAWRIVDHLKLDYEVTSVAQDLDSIPEDIDTLLVIHPKNFSEKTLYSIDQYVLRGGKLLACVDPFCGSDMPPQNPRNPYAGLQHPRASDMNRLLTSWGLKLEPGKVVLDRKFAAGLGGQAILQPVLTPASGGFNASEVINAGLAESDELRMVAPGCLEKVKDTKHQVAYLLRSSDDAGVRSLSGMDLMSARNGSLWGDQVEARSEVMFAARVTGKFGTAFPNGRPAGGANGDNIDSAANKDGEKKNKPAHLSEAAAENSIVVLADVDLISDSFVEALNGWFRMAGLPKNGTFFLNALDYLRGSSELASIRGRGQVRSTFNKIAEIRRKAERETATQTAAIQKEIDGFRKQHADLQSKATEKNVGLLRSEVAKTQREVERNIAAKQRELREVKREARQEEDATKDWASRLTTLFVPLLVVLAGLALFLIRLTR